MVFRPDQSQIRSIHDPHERVSSCVAIKVKPDTPALRAWAHEPHADIEAASP